MKTQASRSAKQRQVQIEAETSRQAADTVESLITEGAGSALTSADGIAEGDGVILVDDGFGGSGKSLETGMPGESVLVGSRTSGQRARLGIPTLSLDDRVGRIILSVILALLLWFYVTSLENPEQTTVFKGLSLDVRGTGTGLKVINSIPTVDTVVQAPQDVMNRLRQSDIHPYIDLSSLAEGVHQVPIQADMNGNQSRSVNVTLSPSTVQVQLEAQVTREYTITVQVTGTPAFGYGVEPPQVNPGRVTVTGGKDAIGRIAQVVVGVDIDQKAGTQRGLKPPVALDNAGREVKEVTFTPVSVQVDVPIKLLLNYKAVQVRVPVIGQAASGFRVSDIKIEPNNVTICCSPGLLEPLKVLDTRPVSITGTTSTIITSTELILPTGVELYPGQTTKVTVTLSVEALSTTLKLSVAPTLAGVSGGMSAVVSPNKLDLTLSGTFAQVQSLNPAEVRATVNLQGRPPGTYEIEPEISLPPGIKLDAASPQKVTVTLIAPTAVPPTDTPVPVVTSTQVQVPTSTRAVPTTVTIPATTVRPTGVATQPRSTVAAPTTSPPVSAPALVPSTIAIPSQQPVASPSAQPTASPSVQPQGVLQVPTTFIP